MQLEDLRRKAFDYANRDGRVAAEEYFFAEQNARLVANAETYYRAMFGGRAQSWNIRDGHMMETLESLLTHFGAALDARWCGRTTRTSAMRAPRRCRKAAS